MLHKQPFKAAFDEADQRIAELDGYQEDQIHDHEKHGQTEDAAERHLVDPIRIGELLGFAAVDDVTRQATDIGVAVIGDHVGNLLSTVLFDAAYLFGDQVFELWCKVGRELLFQVVQSLLSGLGCVFHLERSLDSFQSILHHLIIVGCDGCGGVFHGISDLLHQGIHVQTLGQGGRNHFNAQM